ncbi:DUF3874 domain-containing protein [Cardinium endosymbiont of Bemisia tabaci]|uniref:DUF3874 domain-containing protein n=1 Tax=Cardinium endosymbiont of Bemisia tabaci TaxID=672794 RepID=UPI001CB9306A|nr:DUF3874 domain-containing protein [Cardinium endosymbiont of Bemisia tabaci]
MDKTNGELSEGDLEELKNRSDDFTTKSTESELILQYLSPSNKEEGEFMTATDILRYLQNIVGTSIRLNNIILGKALRELGFSRVKYLYTKGYFVQRI